MISLSFILLIKKLKQKKQTQCDTSFMSSFRHKCCDAHQPKGGSN